MIPSGNNQNMNRDLSGINQPDNSQPNNSQTAKKQSEKNRADKNRADSNQDEFLATIRKALGKATGYTPPSTSELFGSKPGDCEKRLSEYKNRDKEKIKSLINLLMEQAAPINMKVIAVPDAPSAGEAIFELVMDRDPEWGTEKSVTMWDDPLLQKLDLKERLGKENIPLFVSESSPRPDQEERGKFRSRLIQSYIGITTADCCIAQSAALMMRTRPSKPRSVSLVPSIHVAVITADQIMENLKEFYFRLKWDPEEQKEGLTNCMTLISGPSKTADIELVMVHGAHGPREMIVYVITD